MAAKKTKQSPQTTNAYELTDDQVRLLIARENIARYGSPLGPVGGAPVVAPPAAPVARVTPAPKKSAPKKEPSAKWYTTKKTCPHCGKTKHVLAETGKDDFGIVFRRGLEQVHGWCRLCRSKTDYRNEPRKYAVREKSDRRD